jgi:hypothetical protein
MEADRPADAVEAGAIVCNVAAASADGLNFDEEFTLQPLVTALGRLPPGSSPPTQKVPRSAFAGLAHRVALDALQRHDVAHAERAWRALLAETPDAQEVPFAVAGLGAILARAGKREEAAALLVRPGPAKPPEIPPIPTTLHDQQVDAAERLATLAAECVARTVVIGEYEVAVTVKTPNGKGPAKLKVVLGKGAPANLAPCMEARGPAFFVDAPADVRATLAITSS